MEDAGDEDRSGRAPVEYDVAALLHAMQAGTDVPTGAIEQRRLGEVVATGLKLGEIFVGLMLAPAVERAGADVEEIGFGSPGELKAWHLRSTRAASESCVRERKSFLSQGRWRRLRR